MFDRLRCRVSTVYRAYCGGVYSVICFVDVSSVLSLCLAICVMCCFIRISAAKYHITMASD